MIVCPCRAVNDAAVRAAIAAGARDEHAVAALSGAGTDCCGCAPVIAEMKHAETLIERILFLEGVPNMQRLLPVRVGESAIEQFRLNHEMERDAVERYRRTIAVCSDEGDPGSRTLAEDLLREEEAHVDEAEAELDSLAQLGDQLWLAKWV